MKTDYIALARINRKIALHAVAGYSNLFHETDTPSFIPGLNAQLPITPVFTSARAKPEATLMVA